MQKKRFNRMISMGLVIVLTATQLIGCSKETEVVEIEPMEAEESRALALDVIGGKDVMPITGYHGPYVCTNSEDGQYMPDYFTDEIWEAISDCGINLMLYSSTDYMDYPEVIEKSLDLGQKYNMGVVVRDAEIINMALKGDVTKEMISERLSNYMNHPAYAGVYLVDEPHTEYYHPEGVARNNLYHYKQLSPILFQELGTFAYAQAYPSTGGTNEHERFEQYIREYYDVLQPSYLLYDRYPFDKVNQGKMDDHFYDLSIIRMVAKEHDIPFWAYFGAGSQWNDAGIALTNTTEYFPDEGQFDFHINTCLAFGVQGMVFFPLVQPYHFSLTLDGHDFERNGILGAMGNKTRWYYYLQNISGHIEAIDEVLMNSVNKGVLVYGKQATQDVHEAREYGAILEGNSWRELKDVEGDAMVGCFNYQGKTALYVVNYSYEYAQKLNLTFQDNYKVTVIQNGEVQYLESSGLELDMLAGEGALLVFE